MKQPFPSLKSTPTAFRGIVLSFCYDLPSELRYLLGYSRVVSQCLQAYNFDSHDHAILYLSAGDTRLAAKKNSGLLAAEAAFGVAVLPQSKLMTADSDAQEQMILQAIREGLTDLASRIALKQEIIDAAIAAAAKKGILTEHLFKTKENTRVLFAISTRPVRGSLEEEVFFMLSDKVAHRHARWKFGEENLFMLGAWIGQITVSNKQIRTRPRANTSLALAGREPNIIIDVATVLNDEHKRFHPDDI